MTSSSPLSRKHETLLAAATAAIVDAHEAEVRAFLEGEVPANQWRPEKYAEAVLAVVRDRYKLEAL